MAPLAVMLILTEFLFSLFHLLARQILEIVLELVTRKDARPTLWRGRPRPRSAVWTFPMTAERSNRIAQVLKPWVKCHQATRPERASDPLAFQSQT